MDDSDRFLAEIVGSTPEVHKARAVLEDADNYEEDREARLEGVRKYLTLKDDTSSSGLNGENEANLGYLAELEEKYLEGKDPVTESLQEKYTTFS